MSGENPALIVRVVANIEDLKRGLLEGKAVIEATTKDIEQLGGSLAGTTVSADALETSFVSAADVAQQAFQPVPGIFAQLRAGLNDVAEGAGLTFTNLGLITSAGLAIGVGYEAWKITRAVMEFFELDDAVSHAWASLLGFANAGAEAAAAKADVLARASATAGRDITDMAEAMTINAKAVGDWNAALLRARAPDESRLQIEHWNQELDKIVRAGVLKAFTADVESHNFSLKFLSENYGISTAAIGFFIKERKADAEGSAQWAKDRIADSEAVAKAERVRHAAALAEAKAFREFEDDAAKREFEIRNLQTKATNDLVIAELEARKAGDAANAAFLTEALRAAQAQDALNNAVRGTTQAFYAQIDAAARALAATAGSQYAVVGNRPGEGPGINGAKPSGDFSLGGFSLGPTTFAPSVLGSHKDGGPVNEGPAYLHDDEYVVPEGGALVMRSGGGGGTTINLTMHVNGTGADVARVAIDVLTKTMKQGRQYPSA